MTIEVVGKGGISAKMILDSISPDGVRLTTMQLRYHRFIHSEFMTHRMFSRNASSSRAIPVAKMLDQVNNDPAIPIHWGKNQPGMQAREELEGDFSFNWEFAKNAAAYNAKELTEKGLHKQVANRLLEPFQFINVIVTATEWDNFFNLRLHPDAQPEIKELALCMKEVMNRSTPKLLNPGEWHLPYVNPFSFGGGLDKAIKCSVARCARVSYNNHDNSEPDIEKDIELADSLLAAGHMSPMEHQATPMEYPDMGEELPNPLWSKGEGITCFDIYGNAWSGNFRGWIQYRQTL